MESNLTEKKSVASDLRNRPVLRRAYRIAGILCAVGAIAAGILLYWHSRSFESTDDAFIEGGVIQISPRVSGPVARVCVTDNQRVPKGDLLVEIDSRDYQLQVAEAEARLHDAVARLDSARSGVDLTAKVTDAGLVQATAALDAARDQVEILSARLKQQEAEIQGSEAALRQSEAAARATEAQAHRAQADATRYQALYERDEVSKQAMERSEADAKAFDANLEAALQAISGARARLDQSKAARISTVSSLLQADKLVRQAEGKLEEAKAGSKQVRIRQSEVHSVQAQIEQLNSLVRIAELNLSYTQIYAPESGYVTRKSVEPGNLVQIGQTLMGIVSDRLWVIANFKETQLTEMRPGQPASIRVDAYPQYRLRGKVDSIQNGTGARFSLLPAENATGNYVKVIQRTPVKIVFLDRFPEGIQLGPGMSVVPEVRVR
jgi:membrane fusion protein (multidrug efflux system)